MLDYFKKMFGEKQETTSDEQKEVDPNIEYKKLQIATCALFLEVALADDEFLLEEQEEIIATMKNTF